MLAHRTRPSGWAGRSTVALLATLAWPAEGGAARFEERSLAAGVRVVHDPLGFEGFTGEGLQNAHGPGVAWFDINRDGWPDLVYTTGAAAGTLVFLNQGDGRFEEASPSWPLRGGRVGNGLAVADLDNDGRLDLFQSNFFGEPHVWMGTGLLPSDRARELGADPLLFGSAEVPPDWDGPMSMGVATGDVDGNGYVDVYVANYRRMSDMLLRNRAGSLLERTSWVQVPQPAHAYQPAFLDHDDDGDTDIFVVNDYGVDFLFENQGPAAGHALVERAGLRRVAGGADHTQPHSMGMGVAIADFDDDLDLDLYVTHFRANALYVNPGDWSAPKAHFSEEGRLHGVDFPWNSWGATFVDVDNDGDQDLFMAGGWIWGGPDPQPREVPNRLYLNTGPPYYRFRDATAEAGVGDLHFGRGLAAADFDRDGDVDLVLGNNSFYDPFYDGVRPPIEGPLLLYLNRSVEDGLAGHWVNLELVGVAHPRGGCNRAAIGARAYVETADRTRMRTVRSGTGYLSQDALELHFGLGADPAILSTTVRWPCGAAEAFAGVEAGRFLRLLEGTGIAVARGTVDTSLEATGVPGGVELAYTAPAGLPVQLFRRPSDRSAPPAPIELEWRADPRQAGRRVAVDPAPPGAWLYRLALGDPHAPAVGAEALAQPGSGPPPPSRPALLRPYPNPANPRVVLPFALPRLVPLRLEILDARGRRVRTVHVCEWQAGHGQVEWDGTDDLGRPVASGRYTVTMWAGGEQHSQSLALLR